MKKLLVILLAALTATLLFACTPQKPCEHIDADDDGKCDKCTEDFTDGEDLPAPCEHIDADGDGKCDKCAENFPGSEEAPDTPDNPDTPSEPENPENPETPSEPENPETPEEPSEPEEPVIPEYLGITVSAAIPTKNTPLPSFIGGTAAPTALSASSASRVTFDSALREYFAKPGNAPTMPTPTEYALYCNVGDRVYAQVWLSNPDEYSIISLKINGTRYAVGEALSTFNVSKGGQKYTCLWVGFNIPNGTVGEMSFEVTDIEYEGGKLLDAALFADKDTAYVALPYGNTLPTVTDATADEITLSSASVSFNIADSADIATLSGGIIGVAIFDNYKIIANKTVTAGDGTITADTLTEGEEYWFVAYLYADLHDGAGLVPHKLIEVRFEAEAALSISKAESNLVYDSAYERYYTVISIEAELLSPTATFIKLQLLKDGSVVYESTDFNGSLSLSEGILNATEYTARIYYADEAYPEGHLVEKAIPAELLNKPTFIDGFTYTLMDDAVYRFRLSSFENTAPSRVLKLKVYSKQSARYIAEDYLAYLNNKNILSELGTEIRRLTIIISNSSTPTAQKDAARAESYKLEARVDAIENAIDAVEKYYSDKNKAFFEAEAAKGKYLFEISRDELTVIGEYTYAVLKDVLADGFRELYFEVEYEYDVNNGQGMLTSTLDSRMTVESSFTGIFTEIVSHEINGNKLSLSLKNSLDASAPSDDTLTDYLKSYVSKIYYYDSDDRKDYVLYERADAPTFAVDEDAWLAEYFSLLRSGESTAGLYDKYVPKHDEMYTFELDLTKISAGTKELRVEITRFKNEFSETSPSTYKLTVDVKKKLPTPSVEFGDVYTVIPTTKIDDWVGEILVEALTPDGKTVAPTSIDSMYFRFENLPLGSKVRAKLSSYGSWEESDWSDWFTYDKMKVAAPSLTGYSLKDGAISWTFLGADLDFDHYVYTVNGGDPVHIYKGAKLLVQLSEGDVFRIKCVPTANLENQGYADSDWVEYVCTDERERLDTPAVSINGNILSWEAVEGATRYVVTINDKEYTVYSTSVALTSGDYYFVSAYDDTYAKAASAPTEEAVFKEKLANPEFSSLYDGFIMWTGVKNAEGYRYKINQNGTNQTSQSPYIEDTLTRGQELWVQAYAYGYNSSDWVLIYTKN